MRVDDLTVTVRDGANERVVRWPLRTLAAYLFEGRECDEVRALLARGEAVAHGRAVTWAPLSLTPEQLTAIEKTFPPSEPARALDRRRVRAWRVDTTSGETIAIRADDPLLVEAIPAARYRWFDYGPWADVYEAHVAGQLVRFEQPRDGVGPPWEDAQ